MKMWQRIALALLISGSLGGAARATVAANSQSPVQVFILLGQSNMVGLGLVGPSPEHKGSLERAVQVDHLYPFLVNSSGGWAARKNTRFVAVMSGRKAGGSKAAWDAMCKQHPPSGNILRGVMNMYFNQWLSVKGHRFIGPEFGISHEIAKVVHGPTLLLKDCNGNRSLGWDLLTPGSKGYTFADSQGRVWQYAGYGQSPNRWIKGTTPKPIPFWYAGKEYDMDLYFGKYVLANISKFYPGSKTCKIAGFFFWQGEKDLGDMSYARHYQTNLVNYIHDVRRDFNAPNAPFVLGTLGEAIKGKAKGTESLILKAQLAVANPTLHPEFKGNVATVYTHPISKGGSGNGHYNKNAQTYMDVGEAMGKAMDKLLEKK